MLNPWFMGKINGFRSIAPKMSKLIPKTILIVPLALFLDLNCGYFCNRLQNPYERLPYFET
jgi:hypothetical protein